MVDSLDQAERVHRDQFIGGTYRPSNSDERMAVDYPYTGEEWATVPKGDRDDVDAVVSTATDAFRSEEWRSYSRVDRQDLLYAIAEVLEGHTDELARLESKQHAGLLTISTAQIGKLGHYFRYFGDRCVQHDERLASVPNKDGQMFTYVRHEPHGVVGAITPWNAPLLLSCLKIAPALAAGNTFVHKPSEETPVTAYRFAELVYEHTDIPDGVYNVLGGDGETGALLAGHDGVDKLAFTGSVEVGRSVGAKAGENIVPVTLELGGKSPNVVFEDANVDNAVNGAMKGVFGMSGQFCMAGSRIIVQDSIYEEFLDLFKERTTDATVGDPMDPNTDLGPIAFRGQWETVKEYIETGATEGRLVCGGGEPEDADGNYLVEPTIIADVDNDATVASEEIFGPVASVIRFSTEEEAIEIANDTEYGLAAGVWSEDLTQAQRVADQIDAGTVWINEYSQLSAQAPSGGFKNSGVGRELGHEGFSEYLQTKSVWIDQSGEVANPFE